MKKYTFLIIALVFSFALQIKNVNAASTSTSCLSLSNTLTYNKSTDLNSDGEVAKLQDFLRAQGFLLTKSTGNFGPATMDAVKRFQAKSYPGVTDSDIDKKLVPNTKTRLTLIKSGFVLGKTENVGAYTKAKIMYLTCKKTTTKETVVSKVATSTPVVKKVVDAAAPKIMKVTISKVSSKIIGVAISGNRFDKTTNSIDIATKSGKTKKLTLQSYPSYVDGDRVINFEMTDFRADSKDSYTFTVTVKDKVSNSSGVTSEK